MSRAASAGLAALLVLSGRAVAQDGAVGSWHGTVALAGGDFTLRVDIAAGDSGIRAVMDVPESRLLRFPVPRAAVTAGRLTLAVPPGWGLAMFRDIGLPRDLETMRFEGAIGSDAIAGSMTIAHATFPMTLRRAAPAAVPYRREPMSWRNGEVYLAGTLYLPAGRPPFPVMVFTHGSGASTRHEYAAEADALARAGIAALVYDKRGAGESSGANWRMATFRELASDAAAAVRVLRTRPDIDPRKVGLFGLSQGTWLIGMVAEQDPEVGFLVFVSGSGVPVWEQEVYRTGALMLAAGFSDDDVAEARAFKTRAFAVARTGLGWPALDSLRTALRARHPAWFDDYADEFGSLTSARFWWLAAYHYDPTPALEMLTMPVLGLFGEDDLSFPIPVVVDRMRAALTRAGNRDVTLTVFPGAEHQLMVAQEFEGRRLRRVVTPRYLPTLVGWLRGHLVSHRP